jgi:hypothetical protein
MRAVLNLEVPVDGRKLLRAIKKFQRESLAGAYYAPFNMNSNFTPPCGLSLKRCRPASRTLLDAAAENY